MKRSKAKNNTARPQAKSVRTNQAKAANRSGTLLLSEVPAGISPTDPVFRTLRRMAESQSHIPLARSGDLRGPAPRLRKRRRPQGRWPLDLVREASGGGILALRVWIGAGLECYGLFDGDIILITFDDPAEGAPALMAINDEVCIGWYRRSPSRRVTITPFIDGTPAVTARGREVQVLFALKAIVRRLTNRETASAVRAVRATP